MQESVGPLPVARGTVPRSHTVNSLTFLEFLAAAAVLLAVLFNFLLASINANFLDLSRRDVVLTEVLIVTLSLIVCVCSRQKLVAQWAFVTCLLAFVLISLNLFRGELEAKYFRDVLIVTLFVALGITYARGSIVKLFTFLQILIFTVVVFEGVFPVLYGEIVNPLNYYISTRDYIADDFWNTDSNLFVSATRPQDRFLDWIDVHRLSSIFLEPVSLGNWCIVVTIFAVTMWRGLPRNSRYFFVITNIIILVGCDGRLATVTSGIIILLSLIATRLPRHSHTLYLPAVIVAAMLVVIVFDPPPGDTFLGRLEFSITFLSDIELDGILGLTGSEFISRSADSGISYFILSQSILGVVIIWGAICFLQDTTNRRGIVLVHGIAAYVALSLLVSNSMFSIKTAAPLWFLYGYVRATGDWRWGTKRFR